MILSIVLPMYGVEKYIEKSLLSCINQGAIRLGKDYEIICVNDGTLDKSADIAKKISAEFLGIRVIDQENQGLSAARNTGLKLAQGEYVWFVDSDDYIEENCLERICELLKDNIDILQLQYRKVYDDSSLNQDAKPTIIDGVVSGRDIIVKGYLPAPAQFCIYRKAFLEDNGLEFYRGIYHEDTEFKPKATYLARRIASDDTISYNYYQRMSGSITATSSLKRAKDRLLVNNQLCAFSEKLEPMVLRGFNRCIGLNMNSLLFEYRALSKMDQKEVRKMLGENKHLFYRMRNTDVLKYRIEGVVFGISIKIGLLLHSLMK